MGFKLTAMQQEVCRRLQISNPHCIEIESKKRILSKQSKELKKFIGNCRNTRHDKNTSFFDQFLDTPDMAIFRAGASLRLRYKRNATRVYLQYKGPGYIENGLLFRSEFSTERLKHLAREESHHDTIHFSQVTLKEIFRKYVHTEMANAMLTQLGRRTVSRISIAPIICLYEKDKFLVDLGKAFLEPSVDRVQAFHISGSGLHPLSSFSEYENEIKAEHKSFPAKIEHIPDLLEFDFRLSRKFQLKEELLDKYHRCMTIFMPHLSKSRTNR